MEMNVIMTGVFKRLSSEGLIAAVDETEMNRCGKCFQDTTNVDIHVQKKKVIEPELAENVSIFWRDAGCLQYSNPKGKLAPDS